MRKHFLWVVLSLGLALFGCDGDPPGGGQDNDTGSADTGTADTGTADTGVDPDTGQPPDTNVPPDTNQPPSGASGGMGLTNGGGFAETSRYKLTLSIGGPLVSTTMSSTNYKLTIGVGAARPAQ